MYNFNSSITQEEHNVEFQTTNPEGEESIEIFDLNKIFQLNFSYNFDILKNLMEALMKNQQYIQNDIKSKNSKILDLESKIIDLKILIDSGNIKTSVKPQKQLDNQQLTTFDKNPKLFSVIKGNEDILHAPPNDIKLEVSIGHDDIINQIIVS
jgi:hypothetical protein